MEIFVSPSGNDSNQGTKSEPLRTLQAAMRMADASADREITVTLAQGDYRTCGISLAGAGRKLTIRGEKGTHPSVNGGVILRPELFEELTEDEKKRLHGEARGKVLRTDLKKLGLTSGDWGVINAIGTYNTADKYSDNRVGPIWCELFFNDKRMEIARYPDAGFISTGAVIREGDGFEGPDKPQLSRDEWEKVKDPLGDVFEVDEATAQRIAGWKSLDDVWMFGYPMFGWADASTPIRSFDPVKRQLETRYVSLFGLHEAFPYYIFNVFEELDAPGEWYLDRDTGILYMYPAAEGEEFASADICLSLMTEPLITADGADDLTLSGLTFLGTRGTALELKGNGITVEDCIIKNVGGDGLHVTGSGCSVTGCEICYTGKAGVRIGGGDRATLTPSGSSITNNHIHHIAEIYRTYQPGIFLSGVGVKCANNCIHHSAHMAMGFSGNNHVIEYNEIYEVCLNADDSSAIYAGRDYTTIGNIVRYNFFHDMKSDAENHIGIFGMYCDDNLGFCIITGNVFLRCQSALLLHGGHDMVFTNNLVVDSCPKSQYSLRFHPYAYWRELLPGDTHSKFLAEVPWQNEIWTKAYPHIAEYLSWDPETVQRFPHYCRITENIIERHKPIDILFDCHEERWHNTVGNNIEVTHYDGVTVDGDGRLSIDNRRLGEICKGFEAIPFEKMGLCR